MTAPSRPARPISRRPTRDQVVQRVRTMIWDGELRPGDRIPLGSVAEELGVSRIPVREALLDLTREGLVVNELHVGFFVGEFDEHIVRDHMEIFGRLQSMAGQRVAAQGDEEVIGTLRAGCERLATLTDAAEVDRTTFEIHRTLHIAAGSTRLRAVMRELAHMFPVGVFATIPGAVEVQKQAVPAVVEAVAGGERAVIEATCLAVAERRAELVIEHLRATGTFDPK